MFNSFKGIITQKMPNSLCLETHGIEWQFCVSDSTLNSCGNVGGEAKIFAYLQHSEQAMTLFGFSSEKERSLFFDLLKVDGIGAKAAMRILSKLDCERLIDALNSGDLAALEGVSGIGKKTAQKMLLTLKGKLTLDESAGARAKKSILPDVSSALVAMGYDRKIVESAIERIAAEAQNLEGKEKEDFVFRRAIVELAK